MAKEFSKPFYNSKEWKECRDYILKRDAYICQICHINPAEEVHHIVHLNPRNIGDLSVTLNPDNLVSLCKACHFDEHRADRYAKSNKDLDGGEEYEFNEDGFLVKKEIPPIIL